jgi:hypothetical protein
MPHQRPSGAAGEEEAAARIVADAADEPADRKQAASKWLGSQMKEMIKLTTAKVTQTRPERLEGAFTCHSLRHFERWGGESDCPASHLIQ